MIPAVPANVTLTPGAAASGLLTVGAQLGAGTVQVKLTRNPGAEQTTLGLFATLPQVLSFNPAEEVTLAVSALNAAGESALSDPVTATAPQADSGGKQFVDAARGAGEMRAARTANRGG